MKFSNSFFVFAFPFILLFSLVPNAYCERNEKKPNIAELSQKATDHFSKGEFEESQSIFRTILKWEPEDTSILYQYATCLTALGKLPQARDSWSKLIALKPSYHKAYINRASVHLKEGSFTQVEEDLELTLKHQPSDPSALELKTVLSQAKQLHQKLKTHIQSKEYESALSVLDDLLRHTTHSTSIRLMRVEALLATRHFALASGEYTRLFQLTQNMDYLAKIAELTYYSLYEPEKAMKLVKDCLRSDPDHKLGNTLFKAFKKYEKIVGTSAVNVEAVKQLKGTLPSTAVGLLGHISSLLCKKSRSISTCQEAVDSYPDRSDLLKLYIEILSESSEISDLEKAKSLLNDAESKFSSERNTWHKLQSHLQVRIKQAKNIDYYKVLEVPRTATEGQIRKAYRTLAMLHHPDKQKTDEDRKKAEEKMRLINSAYAVLKDAEKKRVYDATGEDPDGPTSRQNPFGNGGDPFMRFFQNGNEGPFGGDNQNFFFFHG